MVERINYLVTSLFKGILPGVNSCPFCKSPLEEARVVDRKYMVTTLVECTQCSLLVRVPTDSPNESKEFYQSTYTQGYTTDCPSKDQLVELVRNNFIGTERDYSRYMRFFEANSVKPGSRILDFGCSWGYGVYQLEKGGYRAEGFEVSIPRAKYGRDHLGAKIHSSREELTGKFDVIFSSHVMEHLPDFSLINELLNTQLATGGLFVVVTPNGSMDFMKSNFSSFHHLWGKVHPVLLSDKFVKRNFADRLTYLGSCDSGKALNSNESLSHYELVYALKG